MHIGRLYGAAALTAVALAISKGAHPKAIQERMGHSSITVTLDRYGHLFAGLDAQIADSLDDLIVGSRGLAAASPTPERRSGFALESEAATSHGVGLNGIEPSTSSLSGMRSNRLSYSPVLGRSG